MVLAMETCSRRMKAGLLCSATSGSDSSKNKDWQGYVPLKEMVDQLWAARGNGPAVNIPALRAYLTANWDVDSTLTYLAIRNWMGPWDDRYINYFLWQRFNGKWAMLGWDFDKEMADIAWPIFSGEGANYFKDSFIQAFREEFKQRLYWLNNTLLDPDNIATLPASLATYVTFSRERQVQVNDQCGFGPFQRPLRPIAIEPAGGESVVNPGRLQASQY